MPPKAKFTRDDIVAAAVSIVRRQGHTALTARALAAELNCSAKPIFGLFKNMEQLQSQVLAAADQLYQSYLTADMAAGRYPPYKASGMAYIRFAGEEKELFKLLFMRDRTGETVGEDRESIRLMLDHLMGSLGLSEDEAYLMHIEMWIYVHGIATMIATSYLHWEPDFISAALTDAYMGLKARFTDAARKEQANGGH